MKAHCNEHLAMQSLSLHYKTGANTEFWKKLIVTRRKPKTFIFIMQTQTYICLLEKYQCRHALNKLCRESSPMGVSNECSSQWLPFLFLWWIGFVQIRHSLSIITNNGLAMGWFSFIFQLKNSVLGSYFEKITNGTDSPSRASVNLGGFYV